MTICGLVAWVLIATSLKVKGFSSESLTEWSIRECDVHAPALAMDEKRSGRSTGRSRRRTRTAMARAPARPGWVWWGEMRTEEAAVGEHGGVQVVLARRLVPDGVAAPAGVERRRQPVALRERRRLELQLVTAPALPTPRRIADAAPVGADAVERAAEVAGAGGAVAAAGRPERGRGRRQQPQLGPHLAAPAAAAAAIGADFPWAAIEKSGR